MTQESPTTDTPLRRRRGVLVLAVALLIVGLLQLPFQQPSTDTRWYSGSPGETVSTETVGVRVDNVRFARVIEVQSRTFETAELFVLMDARVDLVNEVVRVRPWLVTSRPESGQ